MQILVMITRTFGHCRLEDGKSEERRNDVSFFFFPSLFYLESKKEKRKTMGNSSNEEQLANCEALDTIAAGFPLSML